MSASAPSDDGPTCPVCLDNYEAEGHLPLTMPCGHSTCSKCLRAMENSPRIAETGNLCPTCRRPFGPVASLCPNFALLEALIALREKMKADDLTLANLSDLVAEVARREAEARQHIEEEEERRVAAFEAEKTRLDEENLARQHQQKRERQQEEEAAARKLTFADGTYDGDVVAGKPEGRGKYTWADGAVYDGEWKDDKHDGRGKYTWASGSVYDGEWKVGKKEGRGKYTCASGGVYDGEWKDDKHEGRGMKIYADGDVYDGEWKDGKQQGISLTTAEAEEQRARRQKNAAKKAAKKARDRAKGGRCT